MVGQIGGALRLDGVDDQVSVPPLRLYSNTVTLTAGIRINQAVPFSGIFFTRTLSATGLNLGNSGELRYHWNNAHFSWDSGLKPPLGSWTFAALVFEPTRARMWMDHPGCR